MSKLDEGNPIGYIVRRETFGCTPGLNHLVDRSIIKSKNLFRKNLLAHYGCVNALDFSQDGNLLVSGGDDRRILLWNVGKAIHGKEEPVNMQTEHGSNVFALALDSGNKKIFSAGNDDQVICHDVSTGIPLDYFVHEQPVYGVSIDPLNDNIFSSACDDGRLLVYDIREPPSTDPFCLASSTSAFHAVMFHPSEPRLVVSGNSKEGVALWDVRKPKTTLLRYGGLNADQCCMSVRFNGDGSKILALRRRLPPVLYATHDTSHLFQFNHTGYYNSCTMKSCSFAGTRDEFVLSGSDNFDLYMWRIPPPGSNRWVDEAHLVLKGHRSIVNQVRYNKAHSVIMSSGVEKLIKVWSPFSMSSGRQTLADVRSRSSVFSMYEKERRIYSHTEYINLVTQSGQLMSLSFDTSRKTTREDPRMMAFFDALVQRDIEGWSDDSDNIAENSYTVVSQAESSSSDDSNDGSQSQLLPKQDMLRQAGSVDSTTQQQQNNQDNELRENVQTSTDQRPEQYESDSDNNNMWPRFEDGELILTQTSSRIDSSNENLDHPRRSSTQDSDQLSTDEDDAFKIFASQASDIPPVVKHRNIIKELISKKHERLCQLAKAHVILESNIRKPSKKRKVRNYRTRTRSSSGRESGDQRRKKITKSSSSSSSSSTSSSSSSSSDECNMAEKNSSRKSGDENGERNSGCGMNSNNANKNSGHARYRSRRRKVSKTKRPSTSPTSSSRHLNKKKMFESFSLKSLRYERKTPGESSSGSICSLYCQSQGRYQHDNTNKKSTATSSSSSEGSGHDENNQPGTSASAQIKSAKNRYRGTSQQQANRDSDVRSSSSSSSSSSSGSDSDSSKIVKPKPCSSPNLIPKTSYNVDGFGQNNNQNDDDNDSDMENIESSIKNSPAFKLSPLIRRIEMERLRKIRHARENQTKNIKDKKSEHDAQICRKTKRTWSSSSSSASSSSTSSENNDESRKPKRRLKNHHHYNDSSRTVVVATSSSTLGDSGIDVDNCRGDNNNETLLEKSTKYDQEENSTGDTSYCFDNDQKVDTEEQQQHFGEIAAGDNINLTSTKTLTKYADCSQGNFTHQQGESTSPTP